MFEELDDLEPPTWVNWAMIGFAALVWVCVGLAWWLI